MKHFRRRYRYIYVHGYSPPEMHSYFIIFSSRSFSVGIIECRHNDDCADDKYCEKTTRTCQDPCKKQLCGVHALCNATRHQAVCICVNGYLGNPYTQCCTFCGDTNKHIFSTKYQKFIKNQK